MKYCFCPDSADTSVNTYISGNYNLTETIRQKTDLVCLHPYLFNNNNNNKSYVYCHFGQLSNALILITLK